MRQPTYGAWITGKYALLIVRADNDINIVITVYSDDKIDRLAADLTVFDIRLVRYRTIDEHRDHFTTVGTLDGLFE